MKHDWKKSWKIFEKNQWRDSFWNLHRYFRKKKSMEINLNESLLKVMKQKFLEYYKSLCIYFWKRYVYGEVRKLFLKKSLFDSWWKFRRNLWSNCYRNLWRIVLGKYIVEYPAKLRREYLHEFMLELNYFKNSGKDLWRNLWKISWKLPLVDFQ